MAIASSANSASVVAKLATQVPRVCAPGTTAVLSTRSIHRPGRHRSLFNAGTHSALAFVSLIAPLLEAAGVPNVSAERGVFRFGLAEDPEVGVGIFPEREEILVGGLGLCSISG